jgi:hypothetical protein
MPKAKDGRNTPETEQTENAQRSPAYVKVAKRYRQFYRDGQTDDQRDATCRAFYNSISDYLAVADRIAPAQQLAELNVIWRMDCWQDRSRLGETTTSEDVELAISDAIEQVTGIAVAPV